MESKWFLFFAQFSSHSFYSTLAEVMNAESWKSYQERQDFIAKDCLLGSPKPLGLLVVCLLVVVFFVVVVVVVVVAVVLVVSGSGS